MSWRRPSRSWGRHAAPPAGAPAPRVVLADLAPGDRARVTGMGEAATAATGRRLVELGFAPGAEVTALRRAPLGDPVVYRVEGSELSLRRSEARAVLVERRGEHPGEAGRP